jgi:aspartyl-tRNA(Asn)/glutamyl-tRNA(Gln) amidotransferase subunit B
MEKYAPTIGLEVHAELKTKTKMFCCSPNDPDEKRPNVNICPICMAHPGTLPVINKQAVKHVLRVGVAVGGELADFTEFDRKNYFYPDIPKGYQISQYKYPLVSGGELAGVALTRIHLEEDTARSQHSDEGHSVVDYNRAGLPLLELVTEPVIKSAEEAGRFARELQLLLRYLEVAEANMEKGEMRVEANISIAPAGEPFGTKVEVKNLNSFRAVERAIDYELKRQEEVLQAGKKVVQETRGWDENKQITFSQRKKESSHDYRYFPDPDLPKLHISEIAEFANLAETMPELPWTKRERYRHEYGIKEEDIETYVQSELYRTFFEIYVAPKLDGDLKLIQLASNYIVNDLINLIGSDAEKIARIRDFFPDLIKMVAAGEVSSRGAKDILVVMIETGDEPKKIAEERGLFQKSDEGELTAIIEQIIIDNPKVAEDYRAGKEAALQFLVGQGMKATKGAANPEVLRKLIQTKITL